MSHFTVCGLLLTISSTSIKFARGGDCNDTFPVPCTPFGSTPQSARDVVCFGQTLPKKFWDLLVSPVYTNSSPGRVAEWEGLRAVPRCWDVLQPLLCALYMPTCQDLRGGGSEVQSAPRELCRRARQPCRVLETTRGWPAFLDCDRRYFKQGCKNPWESQGVTFNQSTCQPPLVPSEFKDGWFPAIDGCGVRCQSALYSQAETAQVQLLITVSALLCVLCTLFTVLTFLIDWSNASRYPALILFFINVCYTIACLGWLAQFIPGAKEDIVCRKDGLLRTQEPKLGGGGQTASCTVVFVVVYYFTMAALTWFVILCYCWHLMFRAIGTSRDAILSKKGHFHLAAWTLPLVLTIVCLAIQQVDGDWLSGICFVGHHNHTYRTVFVLLPISVAMVGSLYFMSRGFKTLVGLKADSADVMSVKASRKIRNTMIRLGVFAGVCIFFMLTAVGVHIYIFVNEPSWTDSFHKYIMCQLGIYNWARKCHMISRPNVAALELNIFCFFGAGIALSSWSWNTASWDAWKRFVMRLFRIPHNKPVKLKKHEMIAQAFSHRRKLSGQSSRSQVSFSFCSVHDDPLGMKLELNSASSVEASSTWAAALTRMTVRRGALAHSLEPANKRRYSSSDLEDGQSSGKQSGETHSERLHKERMKRRKKRHQRKKKKKHRRGRSKVCPMTAAMAFAAAAQGVQTNATFQTTNGSRRASDTSVWSNSSTQSIKISIERVEVTAVASDNSDGEKIFVHPAMMRRKGSFSSSCSGQTGNSTRRGSFSSGAEKPATKRKKPKARSAGAKNMPAFTPRKPKPGAGDKAKAGTGEETGTDTGKSDESEKPERPGTGIPPAATFSAFNATSSYSMFTASSLMQPGIPNPIELLDLDTPCSCTDCEANEYEQMVQHMKQFHYPLNKSVDLEAEVSDVSTTSV